MISTSHKLTKTMEASLSQDLLLQTFMELDRQLLLQLIEKTQSKSQRQYMTVQVIYLTQIYLNLKLTLK